MLKKLIFVLFFCVAIIFSSVVLYVNKLSNEYLNDSHFNSSSISLFRSHYFQHGKTDWRYRYDPLNNKTITDFDSYFRTVKSNLFQSQLLPVSDGVKFGFINRKGELKINMQFDFALPFSNESAFVKNNGIWFLINSKGEKIEDSEFENLKADYVDGFACVKIADKAIVVNKQFEKIYSFETDDEYPSRIRFSEDLCRIREDEKERYINTSGEVMFVIDDYGQDFTDGMALIHKNCGNTKDKAEKRYAYVNKKGSVISPFFHFATSFSDGRAIVRDEAKFGVIDRSFNYVIDPAFDGIGAVFCENKIPVKTGKKWGVIDSSGELIVEPSFEHIRNYHNGFAAFREKGKWGFIDDKGIIVVSAKFDDVGKLSDSYIPVKNRNKWGLIYSNGERVIDTQFRYVSSFSNGIALVWDEQGMNYFNTKLGLLFRR